MFAVALPARAQLDADKPVDAVAVVQPAALAAGGQGTLKVTIKIMEGGHANANVTADPNLVPTAFTPKPAAGIAWGRPVYPAASTVTEWYSADPLSVFVNDSVIVVPFTVEKSATPQRATLSGVLQAQVCDHDQCYPPSRVTVKAEVNIERK